MSTKLIESIVEMREDEALNMVNDLIEQGTPMIDIMQECKKAMEEVGNKFEEGEYFVPQLLMAAEIMNQITEMTKEECIDDTNEEDVGTVIMGTVEGDIHDIGKGIVNFNLDVNGFNVIDLGEDVSPKQYIDAINEYKPDIVGMSCLLTVAFDSMEKTIKEIKKAGLRDKVKIMIGGAPINEEVYEYTGADGWAKDAVKAVKLAKKFIGV
ncbi:MAG TPA: cobalamin-dependent protein [Halanaerobiales bacterium]|nr:cobalamin-dependent protein [Halanaerobiales bacterium]